MSQDLNVLAFKAEEISCYGLNYDQSTTQNVLCVQIWLFGSKTDNSTYYECDRIHAIISIDSASIIDYTILPIDLVPPVVDNQNSTENESIIVYFHRNLKNDNKSYLILNIITDGIVKNYRKLYDGSDFELSYGLKYTNSCNHDLGVNILTYDNYMILKCSEIDSTIKSDRIAFYDLRYNCGLNPNEDDDKDNTFLKNNRSGMLQEAQVSQAPYGTFFYPIQTIMSSKYQNYTDSNVIIFRYKIPGEQDEHLGLFVSDELTFFKQYDINNISTLNFFQEGNFPHGHYKNSFFLDVKNKYDTNSIKFEAKTDTYEIVEDFLEATQTYILPICIILVGIIIQMVLMCVGKSIEISTVFKEEEQYNLWIVNSEIKRINQLQNIQDKDGKNNSSTTTTIIKDKKKIVHPKWID